MNFTQRIKALFDEHDEVSEEVSEVVSEVVEDVKTLEVKSGDRTFMIEGGELIEGAYIVEVIIESTEEGDVSTTKLIEDGDYTIEDGKVLTIESDLIKSITESEEIAEEEVEEDIIEDGEMFSKAVTMAIEKLKGKLDNFSKEVTVLKTINNSLDLEIKSMKNDFDKQLDEIKKSPADKGVSFSKQGFKFSNKEKTDIAKLQDLSSKYRK